MDQLHANWLRREHLDEMIGGDSVLCNEPLEYVETFRRDLVDSSILEAGGSRIGSVFDQSRVHEMLADSFGNLARHGESGGCSSRDDALWVVRIGSAVGLGETEGSEIGGSVVGGEGIGVGAEEASAVGEVQGYHQRREEIVRVLRSSNQYWPCPNLTTNSPCRTGSRVAQS